MRPRPWLRNYDYWVRPELTWPKRPLSEILDITAIEIPDRPATAFLGAELTYGELKARSDRLASSLARLGVVKGDRVGIMLPNCPQYIIAAFAVLRLGAVVVNINPTYTPPELLNVVTDAGLRVLFTIDRIAPVALALRSRADLDHLIITSLAEYGVEATLPAVPDGTIRLADLLSADIPIERPLISISSDDLAVLQYTGGTTGSPKAAMLTHGNIFANVVQSETWYHRALVRGDARYLLVIPYFHIYAFTVGMMCGTWLGALQVLIPKYDVEQVLNAIRQYRPTYFPAVPTVFVSLLSHPRVKEFGLDLVGRFNSGGAPLPVELAERWERCIGRPLNQGYGLSETSPVTHAAPHLGMRKPETIGLPVPGTDIKVVDVETGTRELPLGEVGELCVAGPQVMKGYWNRPDETAQVLRPDGEGRVWLHTGDIARIDDDGFTTIVQRKKDMIIVDGFNVYPSEVESVLYQHAAVRIAAVIGLPHPYHGEIVKACVVLKEGATVSSEELSSHCAARLAPHKRPCHIEFRDALPTSTVGKILYRVLRDEELARAANGAETK